MLQQQYRPLKNNVPTQRVRTVLKTNSPEEAQKLNLKEILKVYEKQGHYFIELQSAYVLNLTSGRPVMTDTIVLYEITKEQLDEFMHNDDLEVQFQKTDAKTSEIDTYGEQELEEALAGLPVNKYGIGIHSIAQGTDVEKEETASNILETGLSLPERTQSILSTAISLGENVDPTRLAHEISDYNFGQGKKSNIVFAVPEVIQNSAGEKIYLGFPERNKRTASQQYTPQCILDRICSQLHRIPQEFILGYYSETPAGGKTFVPNDSHVSRQSPEQLDSLFTTLSEGMDQITVGLNELVSNRRVKDIEDGITAFQSRGIPTKLQENLLHLIKKYEHSPKRNIIIGDNKRNEENDMSR